jgi:hypothetical protein
MFYHVIQLEPRVPSPATLRTDVLGPFSIMLDASVRYY